MAKQTEFESPPEGHVGLLVYDSVNNKWYAVLGDDDGHIQLEVVSVVLPTDAAKESKQLPDDHNVTVSNQISGFATSLKQLADDHNVTVSNMITGFATETKQLADGHAVTVDNTDIEVVQPSPADLKVSQHQYDGDTWRKSNLLWGYVDTYSQIVTAEYTSTGFKVIDSSNVAAGYVYVVTAVTISYTVGTLSAMYLYLSMGAGDILMAYDGSPALNAPLLVVGQFSLKNPQHVRAGITVSAQPCTAHLHVSGYKMKINM